MFAVHEHVSLYTAIKLDLLHDRGATECRYVTRQGDVSLTSDDVSTASLVLERQPVHGRMTWNGTGIKGDRQRQIYRAVWYSKVGK
jgi:hypothetical protein